MRKIVVTSNCVTGGLASSLKAMLPEFNIEPFPLTRLDSGDGIESLRNLLKTDDIWVTIKSDAAPDFPGQVINIPIIGFRAFHPDITYAYIRDTNELTRVHYNSFIGAWAFNNRVSPEDAARLYNHSTYNQLGYYDTWNESIDKLRSEFLACDFTKEEFEKYILCVKRKGLFMHSTNHPHIEPIIELGKLVASRIGRNEALIYRDIAIPDALAASSVWPLYTEIGQELGLNGNYCWRLDDKEIYGIKSYLEFAYQDYRAQGIQPGDLNCTRAIPNADEVLGSYK